MEKLWRKPRKSVDLHKISILTCHTGGSLAEKEVNRMWKALKQKFAQFLETIAKANRESFGSQPPRCCNPENRQKSSATKR